MAIIYCDRDGVPLHVDGFAGQEPGTFRPHENAAFTVAMPDDIAAEIKNQPKLWRYLGKDTPDAKTRMLHIGAKGTSPSRMKQWKRDSNTFADFVAEKRARAVEQAKENQAAFDTAAMFRLSQPVEPEHPALRAAQGLPPKRSKAAAEPLSHANVRT